MKRPFSYCSEIASPSSFGSATKRIGSVTSRSIARAPRREFLVRERVVERQHRHVVDDRRERGRGLSPGALRRRVGRDEFGVRGFELAQLDDQRVELRVADLGFVVDVVAIVVILDLLAQLLDARARPSWRPRPEIYRAAETDSSCDPRYAPTILDYAPTASFVAAAWSCTRLPISRASSSARSAWLSPCPARPHAGVTNAWRRSRTGSQPRRVSSHHASSSAFHSGCGLFADRAVRRDRAPRDPTVAVEEPRQRDRVGEIEFAHVEVDDVRTGVEREPHVAAAAHVHTGDRRRRERGREEIGRDFAIDRDLRRRATARARVRRRSTRRPRPATPTRRVRRALAPTRARARARERERDFGCESGFDERDTERQRPDDLHLHPRRRTRQRARYVEEREQSRVRREIEHRLNRCERIDVAHDDASCRRVARRRRESRRPIARRPARAVSGTGAPVRPAVRAGTAERVRRPDVRVAMREGCRSQSPFPG